MAESQKTLGLTLCSAALEMCGLTAFLLVWCCILRSSPLLNAGIVSLGVGTALVLVLAGISIFGVFDAPLTSSWLEKSLRPVSTLFLFAMAVSKKGKSAMRTARRPETLGSMLMLLSNMTGMISGIAMLTAFITQIPWIMFVSLAFSAIGFSIVIIGITVELLGFSKTSTSTIKMWTNNKICRLVGHSLERDNGLEQCRRCGRIEIVDIREIRFMIPGKSEVFTIMSDEIWNELSNRKKSS